VATERFAECGYSGTSLRELAEGAGCTKATLYHYFKNKEALFLETIGAQATRYTEVLHRAFVRDGDCRDRLATALSAFLDLVRTDPAGLRLVYRAGRQPEEGQPSIAPGSVREIPFRQTRAVLQDGVDRGEIRSDLNVDEAVFALMGIVDQRCMLLLFEGIPIPEDYPERVMEIFFEGVRS